LNKNNLKNATTLSVTIAKKPSIAEVDYGITQKNAKNAKKCQII
jgi:hypothetical protein